MLRLFFVISFALLAMAGPVAAQTTDKTVKPAAAPAVKPASPPQAAPTTQADTQQKKIPDAYKLNLLIRSTVIAVNQANKTGNYSVLRDLAAPGFRVANSNEKLAEIFAGLRNTKYDLSPIMFFQPKLTKEPGLMENGMLRLTGFFDTRPQRVNFDLAFEENGGEWLLYGVSIGTKAAPAVNAEAGAPASPAGATPVPAAAPNGKAPDKSTAPAGK
jgi:hypothetical protein